MGMTCYFSYSWGSDINEDIMDALKKQIEKMSNYKIQVIYDKRSFYPGDNLLEKEKAIKTSDSIVVFFTPSYKNKIVNGFNDKGAFREYENIKKRLEKEDNNILPILLSGNIDKSVPDEFKTILYDDLSRLQNQVYEKNGIKTFSDKLDKKIKKIVKETIKRTEIYSLLKVNSFNSLEEEYNALFLNSSANQKEKLPQDCYIKTDAYDFIINQHGYFVIGRKGGGKSTLLEIIQGYNPTLYFSKYKVANPIKAEFIDLSFIYRELIEKTKSNFTIIPMVKILDVLWEIILVLQCIYNIGLEIEHFRIDDNDDRLDIFEKVVEKLRIGLKRLDMALDDESPKSSTSILAVELILNYLNNGVYKSINYDTISASAYSNFSSTEILKEFLGNDLLMKFCEAIKRCTKKILLALDGFDPHSEDFRLDTSLAKENNFTEFKTRYRFESIFYRELMITVSNIKNNAVDNVLLTIFDIVDFCIIIPQDRYDEIRMIDRDAAKREVCYMSWDAYDLLNMLVKRLKHYYRIEDNNKKMNLLEEFNSIIEMNIPNISPYISIDIDGFTRNMTLFEYILRLSFWRPRDIIKNFAVVMKLSKQEIEISENILQELLKNLLANNAKKIIDEEFIGEYINVYTNLHYVIHQFENMDLILDISLFNEKLSKINIETFNKDEIKTVKEKFKLLYKLGVIGLFFDKESPRSIKYGYHICYVFNEGLQPCDDILLEYNYTDVRAKIIFNPIFIKYLRLNINTKDLVGHYGWEYIVKNHIMKETIRRV